MPVVRAGKGELLHDVFRLDDGRDCNSKSGCRPFPFKGESVARR
jgi:hypothetical protein